VPSLCGEPPSLCSPALLSAPLPCSGPGSPPVSKLIRPLDRHVTPHLFGSVPALPQPNYAPYFAGPSGVRPGFLLSFPAIGSTFAPSSWAIPAPPPLCGPYRCGIPILIPLPSESGALFLWRTTASQSRPSPQISPSPPQGARPSGTAFVMYPTSRTSGSALWRRVLLLYLIPSFPPPPAPRDPGRGTGSGETRAATATSLSTGKRLDWKGAQRLSKYRDVEQVALVTAATFI